MDKYKIDIFIESRYPADRKNIRRAVGKILDDAKITSKLEVSISIVGNRKIAKLNEKYRGKKGATPVLAFSQIESDKFPESPDGVLQLGDIIVSYPQARELAKEKNKLVDEVIGKLVRHGVKKLLSF